jgi:superfamily II DNA or RNA helicase
MLKELVLPVEFRGNDEELRATVLSPAYSCAEIVRCDIRENTLENLVHSTYGLLGFAKKVAGHAKWLIRVSEDGDDAFNSLMQTLSSTVDRERLGFLGWLLKQGRLEVRVAAPGTEQLTLQRLFSEVTGECLVSDSSRVSGEITTSTVTLFWNWGDPLAIAQKRVRQFDRLWDQATPALFELCEWLKLLAPAQLPQEEPPIIIDPFTWLYKHQREAIQEWAAGNHNGIFKMCTGSGKTDAALVGAQLLDQELRRQGGQGLNTVVVVCPFQVLVEQWAARIRETKFGFHTPPLLAYDNFNDYAQDLVYDLNQRSRNDSNLKIIVTTYDTFGDKKFAGRLSAAHNLGPLEGLLIADEVHNAAPLPMRERLKQYAQYFPYRLGLSATPEIEGNDGATNALKDFFGGIRYTYDLERAITEEVLCTYDYFPIPAYLDDQTSRRYYDLLRRMGVNSQDIALYGERNRLLSGSTLAVDTFAAKMVERLNRGEEISHLLVYCPPGYDRDTEKKQITKVQEFLFRYGLKYGTIVAGVSDPEDRRRIIAEFAAGESKVLLGIGCLDEGLDVPAICEAFVLASYDRERQFVQRRGRILRRAEGKTHAVIRDVVLLPHNVDSAFIPRAQADDLIRREMRRYFEFARLAKNRLKAEEIMEDALNAATQEA